MGKKILLISDIPGYGKVGAMAMIPALSFMGYRCYNLPTLLVSNTLDYGDFAMMDTTDYMEKTIEVWDRLDFDFDCICTGLLSSPRQVDLVLNYIKKWKKKGRTVLVDPVMGDHGSLYHGVGQEMVAAMTKMAQVADYFIPNGTESHLMTREAGLAEGDWAHPSIDPLRQLGAKSVLITSGLQDQDDPVIRGYDAKEDRYFDLAYTRVPVSFPGTGDLFSAILIGLVLQGHCLEDAAKKASKAIHAMMESYQKTSDPFHGIPIEQCSDLLLKSI